MKKLFLLFCLICIAWPLQAAQPVRIGFLGPLTGPYENEGAQAREVLLLLASDLNDRGGLLGKKVEIIFEHEGDNPQAAAAAAKKLLEQKAVAVIGPQTSDAAKAVQEIFHAAGILQISYGATAVSLTQKGFPYFFRTCPRDDEQARAFVRILRKLNFKKVALLHDQSLYGKGLAEAIADELHNWMLQTVYSGSLAPGQSDYSDTLQKIRATHPDIVFFAGYYPEAAALLRGRKQMQWPVPFMGGDGVNHPGLVEMAGKQAARGFHFLTPPNPEHLETPQARAFLDRLGKTSAQKPESIYPLLAGNAFLAFTESAARVQTTAAPAVSDYLHRRYFKKSGLTGEIFFNVWGDVVNDLFAVYFVDEQGRFLLKRQILHGDFI